MNVAAMSLGQLRQHGIAILAKELGPVGMIRFLQQYESGSRDYSQDRHQWLPDDVHAIAAATSHREEEAVDPRR